MAEQTEVSTTAAEEFYHGIAWQPSTGGVVGVRDAAGRQLRPLRHYVKHSPTGFSWGYMGSGAAELARCILLDALGDPHCPACRGTRRRVLLDDKDDTTRPFEEARDHDDDPAVVDCPHCNDDGLAPVPYQMFKEEFVARWTDDQPWKVSRAEVQSWLAFHYIAPGNVL